MELHFDLGAEVKNTPKRKVENTRIGDGLFMVRVINGEDESFRLKRDIDQSLIQFYLSAEGGAQFLFSQGNYKLSLDEGSSFLFYNPLKALSKFGEYQQEVLRRSSVDSGTARGGKSIISG